MGCRGAGRRCAPGIEPELALPLRPIEVARIGAAERWHGVLTSRSPAVASKQTAPGSVEGVTEARGLVEDHSLYRSDGDGARPFDAPKPVLFKAGCAQRPRAVPRMSGRSRCCGRRLRIWRKRVGAEGPVSSMNLEWFVNAAAGISWPIGPAGGFGSTSPTEGYTSPQQARKTHTVPAATARPRARSRSTFRKAARALA